MKRCFILLIVAVLFASFCTNTPKESTTTEPADSSAVTLVADIHKSDKCNNAKADSIKLAENMKKFYDTTVTVLYPKKQRAPKRKLWDNHNLYLDLIHYIDYSYPRLIGYDNPHALNYIFPLYGEVSEIRVDLLNLGDPEYDEGVSFNRRGDVNYTYHAPGDSTDESTREYIYNAKGILIDQKAWISHGRINQPLNAKYDRMGNILERDIWGSIWQVYRATYKYDSRGNLIEKGVFGEDNNTIYHYDSHSNLIMSISGSDPEIKFSYKYDKNDNLVMAIRYENNVAVCKSVYYYNSKGNIYKIVASDINGTENVLTGFKYDSKGNLIKIGNSPKVTITYYK